MKIFDFNGTTGAKQLTGTDKWYYVTDYPYGDIYEAEEIKKAGKSFIGNTVRLICYPEGEVFIPIDPREDLAVGEPEYLDGSIYMLAVDFNVETIAIYRFCCVSHKTKTVMSMSLHDVENTYNLRLHTSPLTLSRQPNDGQFEIVWPDRKTFSVDSKESFYLRDGDRLYFNTWYEDPDYHDETVIRSYETGEFIEKVPGDFQKMPNGEIWYLR